MKRKGIRDGEISPDQLSPQDMEGMEDWERELRQVEAEAKARTLRTEKRRSQDYKDVKQKRQSEMIRSVYGWQEDD